MLVCVALCLVQTLLHDAETRMNPQQHIVSFHFAMAAVAMLQPMVALANGAVEKPLFKRRKKNAPFMPPFTEEAWK